MEEGELTDSTGRKVNFKNTVVVMTSNLGGQVRSEGVGFNPEGKEGQTQKALEQHFTPEFLGRLDRIVCFEPLGTEAMEQIAEKCLRQLAARAAENGVQLTLSEELPGLLCREIKNRDGARQMRRLVQEKVEGPLSVYLLQSHKTPSKIQCVLESGQLQFQG
jgi:ATP-dependent Clp protease ATP-binding subunit ClpA